MQNRIEVKRIFDCVESRSTPELSTLFRFDNMPLYKQEPNATTSWDLSDWVLLFVPDPRRWRWSMPVPRAWVPDLILPCILGRLAAPISLASSYVPSRVT